MKKDWQAKDSTFNKTLNKAYAYAIFPEVGKGGFIVGASHGAGEVYRKGKLIGHAKMTQTTVGAQVGVVVTVGAVADGEHGVLGLVAPARDSLDVALGEGVENLGDVEVLLDGSAEELEAGVAGELLDLVAGMKMRERGEGQED